MLRKSFALAAWAAIAQTSFALNPIQAASQEFVDSVTGNRFEILGIDYQPGGSSGFIPGSGVDPLSDPQACLRDAALMQYLGVNTIRVYNVAPQINHDECASIFNYAGIYMMIDVNSPLPNQAISNLSPASSYNTAYLKRVFQVMDAFRGYPNLLGFISANELVMDSNTGKLDPPYIRAVTRDMKNYMKARGGRKIPIGYSAADINYNLVQQWEYVQCTTTGSIDDPTRSDFFGLNDYQWCGPQATFTSSGYNILAQDFASTTVPVYFSEYGCNLVQPRTFTEVGTLYGPQMTVFSGGLVYEWTQETNNYGLVQVQSGGGVKILPDYLYLGQQYAKISQSLITSHNSSARMLKPPKCSKNLVLHTGSSAGMDNSFNTNFNVPQPPPGTQQLIKNGAGGQVGKIVAVKTTVVQVPILDTKGKLVKPPMSITSASSANAPHAQTGSSSSTGAAAPRATAGMLEKAIGVGVGAAALLAMA